MRFMDKIAVFGDTESVKGYLAAGLQVFTCDEEEEALPTFKQIVAEGFAVIYVTENLAVLLKREIEKYNTALTPSIVPIPSIKGNSGIGVEMLRDAVIKAVGSDIVFNKE